MNATRVSQRHGAKFGGRLALRQKNHPAHQPVLLSCNRRRNGAVIISAHHRPSFKQCPNRSTNSADSIKFSEYAAENSCHCFLFFALLQKLVILKNTLD